MDWNEFSTKRIIEVKARMQTIVVYEELDDSDKPTKKEAVVDQVDLSTWQHLR